MGSSAFESCASLKSFNFPEWSQKYLPTTVFRNCTGLTTLVIPGYVNISNSMFSSCTGLITVNLSDGIRTLDISSFSDCTNLQDAYVFRNCPNIKTVYFPGVTNPRKGGNPFDNKKIIAIVPLDYQDKYFLGLTPCRGGIIPVGIECPNAPIKPTEGMKFEISYDDEYHVDLSEDKTKIELKPNKFGDVTIETLFIVNLPNEIRNVKIPQTEKMIQLKLPLLIDPDQVVTIDSRKLQKVLHFDCPGGANLMIPSDNRISMKGKDEIRINSKENPSTLSITKMFWTFLISLSQIK